MGEYKINGTGNVGPAIPANAVCLRLEADAMIAWPQGRQGGTFLYEVTVRLERQRKKILGVLSIKKCQGILALFWIFDGSICYVRIPKMMLLLHNYELVIIFFLRRNSNP